MKTDGLKSKSSIFGTDLMKPVGVLLLKFKLLTPFFIGLCFKATLVVVVKYVKCTPWLMVDCFRYSCPIRFQLCAVSLPLHHLCRSKNIFNWKRINFLPSPNLDSAEKLFNLFSIFPIFWSSINIYLVVKAFSEIGLFFHFLSNLFSLWSTVSANFIRQKIFLLIQRFSLVFRATTKLFGLLRTKFTPQNTNQLLKINYFP